MTHLFHYKGYVIINDNYMYHLALNPFKKWVTPFEAFREIDRLESYFTDEPMESRIELIKKRIHEERKRH